ncbi:hypothetical protein ACIBI7_47195, partial [Nonomuraea fuscirosea]|uniref:hypothetical protein n=1 Tax=Nonomuraea fuscirosea TaxID=1291556 RepID=UPI003798C5FA
GSRSSLVPWGAPTSQPRHPSNDLLNRERFGPAKEFDAFGSEPREQFSYFPVTNPLQLHVHGIAYSVSVDQPARIQPCHRHTSLHLGGCQGHRACVVDARRRRHAAWLTTGLREMPVFLVLMLM